MKIKPLNNRILVKPEKGEKTTISGLIIPDLEKEKPVIGSVVVGNKEIKAGDTIVFSKFGYDELDLDGEAYYFVSEFNILGVFK